MADNGSIKESRESLKLRFEAGDKPTQEDFSTLIDSVFVLEGDTFTTPYAPPSTSIIFESEAGGYFYLQRYDDENGGATNTDWLFSHEIDTTPSVDENILRIAPAVGDETNVPKPVVEIVGELRASQFAPGTLTGPITADELTVLGTSQLNDAVTIGTSGAPSSLTVNGNISGIDGLTSTSRLEVNGNEANALSITQGGAELRDWTFNQDTNGNFIINTASVRTLHLGATGSTSQDINLHVHGDFQLLTGSSVSATSGTTWSGEANVLATESAVETFINAGTSPGRFTTLTVTGPGNSALTVSNGGAVTQTLTVNDAADLLGKTTVGNTAGPSADLEVTGTMRSHQRVVVGSQIDTTNTDTLVVFDTEIASDSIPTLLTVTGRDVVGSTPGMITIGDPLVPTGGTAADLLVTGATTLQQPLSLMDWLLSVNGDDLELYHSDLNDHTLHVGSPLVGTSEIPTNLKVHGLFTLRYSNPSTSGNVVSVDTISNATTPSSTQTTTLMTEHAIRTAITAGLTSLRAAGTEIPAGTIYLVQSSDDRQQSDMPLPAPNGWRACDGFNADLDLSAYFLYRTPGDPTTPLLAYYIVKEG